MINIQELGSGLPLILFHGWGFDHQIWSTILPVLSDRYHIFNVDLPGFGKTPWMSWSAFSQALLTRVPSLCAVAGWSLGGLYATRLTIEHPKRISHLINITSSPRFLRDEEWQGLSPEIFQRFYQQLALDPLKVLTDFQALQKFKPLPKPGIPPSLAGLQNGLEILQTWDLRKPLHQLKQPVSYLFGRLDAIIQHKTVDCMQTLYPNFEYITFKKSAHMPFLSETSLFLKVLEDFLT